MSRSKSKTVSIANPQTLIDAGFFETADGWIPPEETADGMPLTRDEAFALYTRAYGSTNGKAKRSSENRASADLVSLTRKVCQAYSNNFTQKYTWGEEEISLKKVVSSVVQAWCVSKYAQEGCTAPTEQMVKNAVNSLKRLGEIEGTQKGYFRASAQASINWADFL